MNQKIDVTAAIIVKNDKVLAARRRPGIHLAGYWEFPGGKLKDGEAPEDCLARELQEEFHISTKVGPFFGENLYDYGSKLVRLMAYWVEHLSGEFQLIDHDEICWLTLDELNTVEWAPADIPLVEQYQKLARTAAFYKAKAKDYCEETCVFDMHNIHAVFLSKLPERAHILDLGCGSGRDSKHFIETGYTITAVDGSAEIAACAEQLIGQPVTVVTFQEIDFSNEFDGVWASASLLHCPKGQISDVMLGTVRALKPGGIAFMSFKWGDNETVDEKGRYFNNYTEESLGALLADVREFSIIEIGANSDSLRGIEQKWVNALVRKEQRRP